MTKATFRRMMPLLGFMVPEGLGVHDGCVLNPCVNQKNQTQNDESLYTIKVHLWLHHSSNKATPQAFQNSATNRGTKYSNARGYVGHLS